MKPVARISLFLFVFFFVLLFGYFIYGEFYTKQLFKEPQEQKFASESDDQNKISDGFQMEQEKDGIVQADTSKLPTLNCNTEFIVLDYNLNSDTEYELIESIPGKYIGFDRADLVEELRLYGEAPSLSDVKKGLESVELVSFSEEKVVIRKNYYVEPLPEHYIVVAEDNMITIYYQDLKTVYMNTEIMLEDLPWELQQEIIEMKIYETEEELYNFLESYTS